MKINFTSKDVIKWIMFVYLPLLAISYFCVNLTEEKAPFHADLIFALIFSYPLYLLENLKIKKLFKWIVIGILPFMTIMQILDYNTDWFGVIVMATGFSYFMYPMTLSLFSTLKDIWVMSKEMNLGQKILILSLLILTTLRILRQW